MTEEENEIKEVEEVKEIKQVKDKNRPKKNKKENKSHGNGTTVIASIISLLTGALVMYLLIYYVIPIDNSNTIINKSEKEVTVTDKGIADAVEKLYDAVVVVEVYANKTQIASGTGFVYKTDGKKAYILTNNHVINIKNAKTEVKVVFTNGNEEEVEVEGSDEYSDLAVLSLDANKVIEVAEIGKGDELRLGDTVFTIGAPLDTEYYWTVTRGVVSGKDRMVEVSLSNNSSSDYVMRVLQTDAAINSGNSGGPIANSNGQVIGITNMKLVSSGVEGIGFAIPIEDAVEFAESIISGEKIQKPMIGASLYNLSDDRLPLYREGITLNTELTEGVVIVTIEKGGPADKAGLKRGDIITAIDDIPIKNFANLRYQLYKHKIGDTINIKVEREGKIQTFKVNLNKVYDIES